MENKLYADELESLHFIEKKGGYFFSGSYRLGVELEENRGGRFCYGYVSAYVIPKNQKKIGIAFDYDMPIDKEIVEQSIYHGNTRGIGLPHEFRKNFEHDTISTLISEESFPWCNIVFDQFMYCSVGSNIHFYAIIIRIILSIIKDNLQEKVVNYNEKEFISKYIRRK